MKSHERKNATVKSSAFRCSPKNFVVRCPAKRRTRQRERNELRFHYKLIKAFRLIAKGFTSEAMVLCFARDQRKTTTAKPK